MALEFPSSPPASSGDTYVYKGITYRFSEGDAFKGPHWFVDVDLPENVDPDVYVEVGGDTMTGALRSTDFIGNFGIDKLQELS